MIKLCHDRNSTQIFSDKSDINSKLILLEWNTCNIFIQKSDKYITEFCGNSIYLQSSIYLEESLLEH